MKKLVIFGSGGLGREVLWVVREMNQKRKQFEILGFIDDNPALWGKKLDDLPVWGGIDWLSENKAEEFCGITGIGNTKARKAIHLKIRDLDIPFINLIHPSVLMSQYVEMGKGIVITAGNIITSQIRIGDHVFLNLGCTVGHDAILERYVNCAPSCNISGNVTLCEGAHLGTGVQVLPGVRVGEWTTVGAGAVVIDDLPANVVAAGVPARIIREKE